MIAGPVLELVGTARKFVLRGDAMVAGRNIKADISIVHESVPFEGALFLRGDGGWYVRDLLADVVEDVPLADGDQIEIGDFTLIFHLNAPPVVCDVKKMDRWLTFSRFREYPTIKYAVALDDDTIRSAIEGNHIVAAGKTLHEATWGWQFIDDVAGVQFGDVVKRTKAQNGALLDARIALAAAAAALPHVPSTGADARISRGVHVTWSGEIVWLDGAANHGASWWRNLAEDILEACGCPGLTTWVAGAPVTLLLRTMRAQLDSLGIDSETKRALQDLASAATEDIRGDGFHRAPQATVDAYADKVRSAVSEAHEILGPAPTSLIASVLRELFPDERALDEQIREEAGLLGVEGIRKRA